MQIYKLAEAGHSDRAVPGLRCHSDVYRLLDFDLPHFGKHVFLCLNILMNSGMKSIMATYISVKYLALFLCMFD